MLKPGGGRSSTCQVLISFTPGIPGKVKGAKWQCARRPGQKRVCHGYTKSRVLIVAVKYSLPIHMPFAAGGDMVAQGFEDLPFFLAGFGVYDERLEKPGGTVCCCARPARPRWPDRLRARDAEPVDSIDERDRAAAVPLFTGLYLDRLPDINGTAALVFTRPPRLDCAIMKFPLLLAGPEASTHSRI